MMDYNLRLSFISNSTSHVSLEDETAVNNFVLGSVIMIIFLVFWLLTCGILFKWDKIKQHWHKNQDFYFWVLGCCLPCASVCHTNVESSV